ncbi:MAG: JAB domain-containing protein, partial [Candidatus Limnocylindria bacterium]
MSAVPRPTLSIVQKSEARPASAIATTLARLGAPALRDDELLALLLGGRAGSAQARSLLERHGLAGLATAQLVDLPVGARQATCIVAAIELGRRVAAAWPVPGWRIRAPADLAERLLPDMGHLEREELRSVLLNTKNTVTGMVTVYAGNLAGSSVRVGEVFREAVRRQAAAMVVVHNHPSGDPSPSAEDLR